MSRFAIDPKWLIYLPPTMSPSESSNLEGIFEHPREALDYFRNGGVARVICEEKHMGSRAVVIVCRDGEVVTNRFGIVDPESVEAGGVIYTRTGRRFFNDDRATERTLLSRLRSAATASGTWEELSTDWLCLDCELMPWSAKAQELLKHQYAAVGSASRAAWTATIDALANAASRLSPPSVSVEAQGEESAAWLNEARDRAERASKYIAAYRRYCWPVAGVDDLKLAPFHILASEGRVHVDRDHTWHMQTLARLAIDPIFIATNHLIVDVTDPSSVQAAIDWWLDLTTRGGEGMVVKPLDFIARGPKGLLQPAIKCRGGEYLRIIYGPEFDRPIHLERLRKRGVSRKRALAVREFSMGVEALERFTRREPLRRTHECVFGVLALESEPVDPRL